MNKEELVLPDDLPEELSLEIYRRAEEDVNRAIQNILNQCASAMVRGDHHLQVELEGEDRTLILEIIGSLASCRATRAHWEINGPPSQEFINEQFRRMKEARSG